MNSYREEVPPNGFGLDMILKNLATYCHKLEALQLSGYHDRGCDTMTEGVTPSQTPSFIC